MIVEKAGFEHEIEVAHIHIVIVDGSSRILYHVFVLFVADQSLLVENSFRN